MLRFNIQQAKKDGLSDEQITRMIQQGPPQAQAPTTAQAPAQGNQNLLASLLPLLGSLVGGGIGSIGGPGGVIAGSAIGSGLGEAGRQSITGEKFSGGKILGETAIGGIGAGAGELLSGAFRGARAVKAGAGVADDVAKAGAKVAYPEMTVGQKLAAKPYVGEAVKKIKSGNVALKAAQVGETANATRGATAPAKLLSLNKDIETLTNTLFTKTQTGKNATKAVDTAALLKEMTERSAKKINLSSGTGKALYQTWGPVVAEAGDVKSLSNVVKDLLVERSTLGPKTKEYKVLTSFLKPLEEKLHSLAGTSSEFAKLSRLRQAAPVIQSQAAKQARLLGVYETQLPFRAQEVAQSYAGKAVNAASNPNVRRLTGQLGTRAITSLAGSQQPGMEGYGGQVPGMPEPPQQPVKTPGGLNITAQQVALARLTLPSKQADAIEAAYKILNPDGKDKTETQMARDEVSYLVDSAISQLATGSVKTGPIAPKLENLKSILNAGDPETINFNVTVAALTAAIAKARAGTSFTESEKRMLEQYAPRVGDSQQQLMSKLATLQTRIQRSQ